MVEVIAVLLCRAWVFRKDAGVLGDFSCRSPAAAACDVKDIVLSRQCGVVGVVTAVVRVVAGVVVFIKEMERAFWNCSRSDIHF